MAEGRNKPLSGKGESSTPAPELVLDEPLSAGAPDDLPFPMQLPPAMFSGPGLLTLADLLPVMTAFVDRDLVYRFMNKPLAEWLGRPRARHDRASACGEVLGEKTFAERKPMLEAALAASGMFFASEFEHPQRGHGRGADRLRAVGQPATGRGRRASSSSSPT